MQESKINSFNTEPLVIEIENVIKKGLNTILKDYMSRYELLEQTHNQIMNLPSVRNELNKHPYEESDEESDEEDDVPISVSIKDMTQNMISEEIGAVEKRLDRMEKKYELLVPILDKILCKIQSLNDDMKSVKSEKNESKQLHIITPSIVSACENENIKFEIKETEPEPETESEADIESGNEDEDEESGDKIDEKASEEEIDEEEFDNDEDDFNPAIITCSTIVIKTENTDNKLEEQEQSVEEEEQSVEEDEELSVGEELGEHLPQENTTESFEEEVEDEDEVETEASEEEEEEEEVEVKVETPPVEDEEELEIITIDDIDYCTNDMENGFIWELTEDGEQGEKVGYLKEGEPFFYADEN